MTSNGNEMAIYIAYGVGRFSGPGGRISFRGSVYYRTSSTEGKLSSINNLVGVFEYGVMSLEAVGQKSGNGNRRV